MPEISSAIQGARPHSKPPFLTTELTCKGAQVALGVEVAWDVGEEVGPDVDEDTFEDTTVTDDAGRVEDTAVEDLPGEDAEDAEVADGNGLGV